MCLRRLHADEEKLRDDAVVLIERFPPSTFRFSPTSLTRDVGPEVEDAGRGICCAESSAENPDGQPGEGLFATSSSRALRVRRSASRISFFPALISVDFLLASTSSSSNVNPGAFFSPSRVFSMTPAVLGGAGVCATRNPSCASIRRWASRVSFWRSAWSCINARTNDASSTHCFEACAFPAGDSGSAGACADETAVCRAAHICALSTSLSAVW